MMSPDAFSPADLVWNQLDPRWIAWKRIRMAIMWGTLTLMGCLPFLLPYAFDEGTPVWVLWVGVGIAVMGLSTLVFRIVRSAPLLWKAAGYAERGEDLYIRYGIWWRRLTVVPYGRMQLVDVEAGPIERAFGLASVKLVTAASHTNAHIRGLSASAADQLREHLIERGDIGTAGL